MYQISTPFKCPRCNGEYVCHDDIDIFSREKEDGPVKSVRIQTGGGFLNLAGATPSDRREAVRIWFKCEGCTNVFTLLIIQHKGQTLIDVKS